MVFKQSNRGVKPELISYKPWEDGELLGNQNMIEMFKDVLSNRYF